MDEIRSRDLKFNLCLVQIAENTRSNRKFDLEYSF